MQSCELYKQNHLKEERMMSKSDTVKKNSQPSSFETFVQSEVTREESRRVDFRARSVTLLGVSGVFVTTTSGFFTIASKSSSISWTSNSRDCVIVAVSALVLSAFFALLVNTSTHDYVIENVDVMDTEVVDSWNSADLNKKITLYEIDYLRRLRQSNTRKKWLFNFGIFFQIFGIAAIAAAMIALIHLPQ